MTRTSDAAGAAPSPSFLEAGDTALIVEFGRVIDRHASALVLDLAARLEAAAMPGIVETVPTFRSLMVHYDPLRLSAAELKAAIAPMLAGLEASERQPQVAAAGLL